MIGAFAILVATIGMPTPWPPRFDSLDLTNRTMQRVYASHPPLRAWVRAVLAKGRPTWKSVDDLLDQYVSATRSGLFVQDVWTINLEEDLRKQDPTDGGRRSGWGMQELKYELESLKKSRMQTDPSGGVNMTAPTLEERKPF